MGRAPAEVAGPLHGAGLRVVVLADGAAARQPLGVGKQLVDQHLGIAAIAVVLQPLHPEVELIQPDPAAPVDVGVVGRVGQRRRAERHLGVELLAAQHHLAHPRRLLLVRHLGPERAPAFRATATGGQQLADAAVGICHIALGNLAIVIEAGGLIEQAAVDVASELAGALAIADPFVRFAEQICHVRQDALLLGEEGVELHRLLIDGETDQLTAVFMVLEEGDVPVLAGLVDVATIGLVGVTL
ncbi:hypothetical protein D3C79_629000 [compost metagenome]